MVHCRDERENPEHDEEREDHARAADTDTDDSEWSLPLYCV